MNRPIVIMCPGVSGDNERFAQFRALFARDVQFVVPSYPDWDEIVRKNASLALFIDAAVEAALPWLPERRPVALVGYSFGGLIAHEVALTLFERGHDVGVLCVLDADVTFGPSSPAELKLAGRSGRVAASGGIRLDAIAKAVSARVAYHAAIRVFHSTALRRTAARFRPRLPLPADFASRFDLLLRLWTHEAVARAWQPRTHHLATVVFRSKQQYDASVPADLGWSRYAKVVAIEEVGGSHYSMITGTHGKRLARLLETTFATHL